MQGYEEASADSKRWVPTSADLPGLEGTPAERLQYDAPDGCQQRDYRCAAIAHYSLFDAFHRARFKARQSLLHHCQGHHSLFSVLQSPPPLSTSIVA